MEDLIAWTSNFYLFLILGMFILYSSRIGKTLNYTSLSSLKRSPNSPERFGSGSYVEGFGEDTN